MQNCATAAIEMNNSFQLFSAADAALGRGDWRTAIAGYRTALAGDATNAAAWFNLGYALRAVREFEGALAAYQSAINNGLDGVDEAFVNRAAILSEHLAAPEAAEKELDAALLVNPQSVPALLNKGMLKEDSGDAAGAKDCYERVLSIDPVNGRALLRQTMIAIHEGRNAAQLVPLRTALAQPGLGADEQVDIGFALANALDAAGHYGAAWDAVLAANAADVVAVPPASRYNRAKHEEFIEALMTTAPLLDGGARRTGHPPLIFICGLFRSGSTLAEQMLARHPAVTAGGELELIPALITDLIPDYPAALATADAERVDKWRDFYLTGIRNLVGNTGVVTDKRCDNFLHIGLIKTVFPDAKIVHTTRDPNDVLISTLFLRFGHAVNYGASPEDFAHWYGQYRRLMEHWETRYGPEIVTLNYDHLVAGPEQALRALLKSLGLEWHVDCLGLQGHSDKRVMTASNWQVRQPVHQRSSGRARAYASQIAERIGSLTTKTS